MNLHSTALISFTVTFNLYQPDISGVAFGMTGFGSVEVKPLGPVQLYFCIGTGEDTTEVKNKVSPEQRVELLLIITDVEK